MEKQKFGKLLKRLLIVCLCLVMALGSAATIFADGFNGDLNNDGAITSFDAQMLAEYEAGLRELSWTEEFGLTVRNIINTILGKDLEMPNLDNGIETAFEVKTEDGIVTKDKTVSVAGVTATVPAGTKVTGKTLKLTVKKTNSTEGDVALEENQEQLALDIHVDGVAADNTTPIVITVENALEGGYNQGNLELYHVENSVANEMAQVNAAETLNEHNSFYYDPATGDVTVAMATFSVVLLNADTTKVWNGEFDYTWYTWYSANETFFKIFNADQLAAFGAIVDGTAKDENGNTIAQDSFEDKTVTLCMDVTLSDGSCGENESENKECTPFNPIGYGYNYQDSGKAFKGTFDGNGNTIYNLYQNGWDLGYSYSTAGGGLFASAYDATIKNLTMDNAYIVMECIDMGTVVGYAQGDCVFENIVVRNSTLANYQRYTGGVIGEVSNGHHILKNVDVEASTTVGSLWGDFDNASGGLIGGKWGHNYDNETGEDNQKVSVYMKDCDVAATLDVYNDVTSAYQWYSYRRCGMLIGMSEENTTINGRTQATATYLTTENCTVTYTGWEDYHYCEFGDTTSLEARYPWVRVEAGNFCGAYSNVRYGVPTFDGDVKLDADNHTESDGCHNTDDGHYELIKFNQLYGGGQGCYGGNSHAEGENPGVKVSNVDGKMEPAIKFVSTGVNLIQTDDTVKLGELFKAAENAKIQSAYVYAFVSPANETSTVGITSVAPTVEGNWENMEIKFSGKGAARVVITDYNYCKETELYVTVGDLGWVLVTDASELTAGDKIVVTSVEEDEKAPGYYALSTAQGNNNRGAVSITKNNDEIIINDDVQILTLETGLGAGTWAFNTGDGYLYAAATGSNHLKTEAEITVNGSWKVVVTDGVASVVAEGSSYRNVMRYNPNNGTPLFSCYESASSVKNIAIYKQSIVCAHKGAEVISETAPTCTDAGSRTLNCPTCGTITEVIPALGHKYESVVTEPTCTAEGYTTYTCGVCGDKYIDDEKAALGHTWGDDNICDTCQEENTNVSDVTEIVFDFGENGDAGHKDGAELDEGVTYSKDGYALKLTNLSKVYGTTNNSNLCKDEKGNSCIKLGTSKVVGSFEFSVPEDVTKVIIAVAKYKSNSTKIKVNSTEYTLTKNSDAGEYDLIEIDTTSVKTISVTTVATTYRAMINSITYVIGAGSGESGGGDTSCEHNWLEATCTTPKTCSKCKETEGEALGHTESYKDTGDDANHDVVCTVCENTLRTESHDTSTGKCACGYEETTDTPSEPITTTYTFSDYTAGTQYAENEKHVLDENVIITTTQSHFTEQLRIYSSSEHNGYAIIKATGKISSLTLNAGYKKDTINIYGSNDGVNWTNATIGTIATTTTSYTNYTVEFAEGNQYQYLKLDVAGSNQVRIATMTLTWLPE